MKTEMSSTELAMLSLAQIVGERGDPTSWYRLKIPQYFSSIRHAHHQSVLTETYRYFRLRHLAQVTLLTALCLLLFVASCASSSAKKEDLTPSSPEPAAPVQEEPPSTEPPSTEPSVCVQECVQANQAHAVNHEQITEDCERECAATAE